MLAPLGSIIRSHVVSLASQQTWRLIYTYCSSENTYREANTHTDKYKYTEINNTCALSSHFSLTVCWNLMLVQIFHFALWLFNVFRFGASIDQHWVGGIYMAWCATAHQCKRTFLNVAHTDVKVKCMCNVHQLKKVGMCTVNWIYGVVFKNSSVQTHFWMYKGPYGAGK